MKLLNSYLLFYLKDHFRNPTYMLSTVVFPSLFFGFLAAPNINSENDAQMLFISFSCFSVIGIVFFQRFVSLSEQRLSPWTLYVDLLNKSWVVPIIARSVESVIISFLSILMLLGTTVLLTEFNIYTFPWYLFIFLLSAGALPFCFFGIALSYWVAPQNALPVGNLVYLPATFLGGLWIPPNGLPSSLATVSEFMPTRMYAELLWNPIVRMQSTPSFYVWGLFIASLLAVIMLIVSVLSFEKRVMLR